MKSLTGLKFKLPWMMEVPTSFHVDGGSIRGNLISWSFLRDIRTYLTVTLWKLAGGIETGALEIYIAQEHLGRE